MTASYPPAATDTRRWPTMLELLAILAFAVIALGQLLPAGRTAWRGIAAASAHEGPSLVSAAGPDQAAELP